MEYKVCLLDGFFQKDTPVTLGCWMRWLHLTLIIGIVTLLGDTADTGHEHCSPHRPSPLTQHQTSSVLSFDPAGCPTVCTEHLHPRRVAL